MSSKKNKPIGGRRATELVEIEVNKQKIADEKYFAQQQEMYEYFKELKILNQAFENRYKKVSETGGPLWNEELSVIQREALDGLKLSMHMDIGQGTPYRTVEVLSILGILPNYAPTPVMKALQRSHEDPINFIKGLYISNYNEEPTAKLDNYILEQKLLLSSIVHLELLPLIKELDDVIPCVLSKHSIVKPPPRKMRYKKVNPYLLKSIVPPVVKTNMYRPPKTPKPPPPLCNSFITRFGLFSSDNIYSNTRSTRKQKRESNENGEEDAKVSEPVVTGAEGFQGYPYQPCGISCGCVRWFTGIVRYIIKKREQEEEERKEQLRRQQEVLRVRMEERNRERMKRFKRMKKNVSTTSFVDKPKGKEKPKSIYPPQLKKYPIGVNEFLLNILEEISKDKYYMLSLPDVHKLPKLQEWARLRLMGEISQDEKDKSLAKSRTKWLILATQQLKIKPPELPFSKKQLFSMTWDDRHMVNVLAKRLRDSYYKKTKRSLIQIGQVWWSTMEAEKFHNKHFRNVYFSYLPAREKDVFMIRYDVQV